MSEPRAKARQEVSDPVQTQAKTLPFSSPSSRPRIDPFIAPPVPPWSGKKTKRMSPIVENFRSQGWLSV